MKVHWYIGLYVGPKSGSQKSKEIEKKKVVMKSLPFPRLNVVGISKKLKNRKAALLAARDPPEQNSKF